jgi:hypothetical protein
MDFGQRLAYPSTSTRHVDIEVLCGAEVIPQIWPHGSGTQRALMNDSDMQSTHHAALYLYTVMSEDEEWYRDERGRSTI